jgi:hypothetical protein
MSAITGACVRASVMIESHHILLATVSFSVACWYVVGLSIFVSSPDRSLSTRSAVSLSIAHWTLLAIAVFTNVAWTVHQYTERRAGVRLSDGAWRTDVLLRLALSIAVFSVAVAVIFADGDSSLFEIDFADRLLLTPLTSHEVLLCPLVLAPLYFFLFFFAVLGRSRGNAIKLRSL